jgi:hypothetical protein
MPCSHLIFDGFSSELLEIRLNEAYESALVSEVPELKTYAYTEYAENVRQLTEKLTAADLDEALQLGTFFEEVKAFLQAEYEISWKYYVYSAMLKENTDKNILWNISQACLSAILDINYQTEKVPILLVADGRQYQGYASDCIGEHIDTLPVLFAPGRENSEVFTSLASRVKLKGINFSSVLFSDAALAGLVDDQTIRTMRRKIWNIPTFNFIVAYKDTEPLIKGQESSVREIEGMNSKLVTVHVHGNTLYISSFCDETKYDLLKKRLDEIVDDYNSY